ncbi:acetoacetate--CoA ligase [Pseudophaeobacter sp. EL27]|uniref:acetoacetate--CoA ligase n=1 Tax=Pseudophaeobacter sp. EL27 TaxID=2107580 RepID=UPI000EFB7EA8|nr:acetoacetate--CoA ligase [Pseudophaeobacter sp. EL27]
MNENPILWTPTAERAEASQLAAYQNWLRQTKGLEFASYNELWSWSTTDLEAFWQSICDYFDLKFSATASTVLADRKMPGAKWFPGAQLNWAENILSGRGVDEGNQALIVHSETFGRSELSWVELRAQVASLASHLRDMGIGQGDRVAAILPNTESAIIACLAASSLGAIWSLCAPDMGHVAILDRFRQIKPKVLIYQDSYLHGGKENGRQDEMAKVVAGLPSLEHHIYVATNDLPAPTGSVAWSGLLNTAAELSFAQVDFDHPLWIVYSSGTTGNPKPIVHGHGGILLEGSKQSLHLDLAPGSRFCWLTSSGWVMWNLQLGALGQGVTVMLYDRAPNYPDMLDIWRRVADERMSYFGAGAAFFTACAKSGIEPGANLDLTSLVSLGATGSPMTSDGYDWVYRSVSADIWLAPVSGGTDFCGAFVGGNVMLPVRAGEMQARALGNAVRAFDPFGAELTGEVGELVCTEPLPSMPLFFWGDEDGSRLRESYFETYPGIWRHGDWISFTAEGGSVIYGRSDATINRRGLRLGSSEIYQAVEALPEIQDSLVVDLEFLGKDSFMPLFVVLTEPGSLDEGLKDQIKSSIREFVSARFVPDEIIEVAEIPRTLSGKKLEVPVKKLLLGGDPAKVVNRDSMVNSDSFDLFISYANDRKH